MEGVETNSKESVITLVFFSKAKPLNEFFNFNKRLATMEVIYKLNQ